MYTKLSDHENNWYIAINEEPLSYYLWKVTSIASLLYLLNLYEQKQNKH